MIKRLMARIWRRFLSSDLITVIRKRILKLNFLKRFLVDKSGIFFDALSAGLFGGMSEFSESLMDDVIYEVESGVEVVRMELIVAQYSDDLNSVLSYYQEVFEEQERCNGVRGFAKKQMSILRQHAAEVTGEMVDEIFAADPGSEPIMES